MNVEQFKALAKSPEFQNLASIAIFKRAKAEVTRERVNAYILPVFNRFEFFVAEKWQRTGKAWRKIKIMSKIKIKKAKRKPEQRSRQAKWQQATRAEGYCPRCGQERLGINARTGKPYKLGPVCRKKEAETQKLLMRARRAEAEG